MFYCVQFRLDYLDPPRSRRYFEGEYPDKDSMFTALAEYVLTLYPFDDTLFKFRTPKLVIISCSEYLSSFK